MMADRYTTRMRVSAQNLIVTKKEMAPKRRVSFSSPWRTPGMVSKIRYCLQGVRTALQEKSVWYVLAVDAAMLYQAHQIEDDRVRPLYQFVAVLPMTVELINSSIERAVDRVGFEYSELARDAKDIAAAASMYAHIISATTIMSASSV